MTTEQLRAEAERLAAERSDSRTPAVVRRALLEPDGLTLRGYLALEEADSPLLGRRPWPVEDAGAMAEAFCTAWEAVCPGRSVPMPSEKGTPQALALMAAALTRAFSTLMPMRFPKSDAHQNASAPVSDGLGWVARVLGRLAGLGWKPHEVLDLPMDRMFLLLAGISAADGAECAGEDYRTRTLPPLSLFVSGGDQGIGKEESQGEHEEQDDTQKSEECAHDGHDDNGHSHPKQGE
jgi:hypothetical protein